MGERFPGYDVLSKRHTASWNPTTRAVIEERLAIGLESHTFFNETEWAILKAVCSRILPQPADRPTPVPTAALVDQKLSVNTGDGYRDARMPSLREAWRRGLAALEAEAQDRQGCTFHALGPAEQDGLLSAAQNGFLTNPAWGDMRPDLFFRLRMMPDCVAAYYGHPTAWNEIGYGGPAAPRGYVRMDLDRRDPWEAAEAHPGQEDEALRENRRVGRR
jgi:hypothetical protein